LEASELLIGLHNRQNWILYWKLMVLPSLFYWLTTLLHNMWVPTGLENSGGFLLKVGSVYIKSTKTYTTACIREDILLNILLVSESYNESFALRW